MESKEKREGVGELLLASSSQRGHYPPGCHTGRSQPVPCFLRKCPLSPRKSTASHSTFDSGPVKIVAWAITRVRATWGTSPARPLVNKLTGRRQILMKMPSDTSKGNLFSYSNVSLVTAQFHHFTFFPWPTVPNAVNLRLKHIFL